MRNTVARVTPRKIGALEAESLLTEYLALIGVTTRKGGSMQGSGRKTVKFSYRIVNPGSTSVAT